MTSDIFFENARNTEVWLRLPVLQPRVGTTGNDREH
jgi:hypothetical protein